MIAAILIVKSKLIIIIKAIIFIFKFFCSAIIFFYRFFDRGIEKRKMAFCEL